MPESNQEHEGIFPHKCEEPGCKRIVQFDDEPKCFEHSPNEGSDVFGYSAKKKAEEAGEVIAVHRNVFDE